MAEAPQLKGERDVKEQPQRERDDVLVKQLGHAVRHLFEEARHCDGVIDPPQEGERPTLSYTWLDRFLTLEEQYALCQEDLGELSIAAL